MARGLNEMCRRCGVIHFSLETEENGDLVHFQIVVTKWPCTAPVVVSGTPRLSDMVGAALVSGRAA